MRVAILAAIALVAATAAPALAQPKPKAKTACGLKQFPLTVGNKWTFVPGTPPVEPDEAKQRLIPVQPKQINVEVKDITTDGGKTIVKLEEDLDGRKIETTITCGGGVFEASLDSIFY